MIRRAPDHRGRRSPGGATRLAGALLFGFTLAVAASAAAPPALYLDAGSTAGEELVALGRDLIVAGEARSDAVAVGGGVEVRGSVAGDVIALDGDVRLTPGARVGGDVYVLGGRLLAAPQARIAGRTAAYPTAGPLWLGLLEGRPRGLGAAPAALLATQLALLAGWLVVLVTLLSFAGKRILSTAEIVAQEPLRDTFLGLGGVLALALTGLLLVSMAPGVASFPLLVVVVLAAMALKIWGVVAVICASGRWLARKAVRRNLSPLSAALLGFAVLGGLKLVPVVGIWVWTVVSLLGIGATLRGAFAHREPRLGHGDLERLASLVR